MERTSRTKTLEEKKELVAAVDRLIKSGTKRDEAYREVGISDVTYYAYRKSIRSGNGLAVVDGPKKEAVMGLEFSVIGADEAKDAIGSRMCGSRFGELRFGLIAHLKGLRKSEAISFPSANPEDKKERNALITACNNAIRNAGLPWKVRWSHSEKKFIVIHTEKLNTKEAIQ